MSRKESLLKNRREDLQRIEIISYCTMKNACVIKKFKQYDHLLHEIIIVQHFWLAVVEAICNSQLASVPRSQTVDCGCTKGRKSVTILIPTLSCRPVTAFGGVRPARALSAGLSGHTHSLRTAVAQVRVRPVIVAHWPLNPSLVHGH